MRVPRKPAAAILAAAFLVVGTATASVAGTPNPGPVAAATSDEAFQAAAAKAVTDVGTYAAKDPSYAGVSVDSAHKSIVVYRKAGGSDTSVYDGVSGVLGVPIEFSVAQLTAAEALTEVTTISAARDQFAAAGVTLVGVQTTLTGPVIVGVDEVTPAAVALANKLSPLGASAIQVQQMAPLVLAGRLNDTPPWYGGDHIESATGYIAEKGYNGYENCTSGFSGVSSTNQEHYVLTAFHCVDPSDKRFWAQGSPSNTVMGTVTTEDSAHDIVYMPVTSSSPTVWTGAPSAGTTATVTAMAQPATNNSVCSDGYLTGEVCGATVKTYGSYTLTDPWTNTTYSAVLWYATASTPVAQQGDSGSPVFIKNGSNVTAVGMLSALGGGTGTCPYGAGPCYKTIYFTDVYTEAYKNHQINLTQ